ncbi:MAG: S9 family peptidase, partial [Xanthomonadales bacterium]|nr:S9 family peptidase [Xanthomonadales bacterium]
MPTRHLLALALATASLASTAGEPIPVEALAKLPDIQSVSMSADGKNVVALVAAPGGDGSATALASWDLGNLDAGSRITPSGDRMKFVAANAMKADRILVIARQEWTGQLGGCGEGKTNGATKTFVSKTYLTDTSQKKFDEAFAAKTSKIDMDEDMRRCLELVGTSSLVNTLPLDPDNVIITQMDPRTFGSNYMLYNLRTG